LVNSSDLIAGEISDYIYQVIVMKKNYSKLKLQHLDGAKMTRLKWEGLPVGVIIG